MFIERWSRRTTGPITLRRSFVTLMEIMIVMIIIALVLGALAWNYQGALEKGKVFKADSAKKKIENILNLRIAEQPAVVREVKEHWKRFIEESPLVTNPEELYRDPWGYEYQVEIDENGNVTVTSEGITRFVKNRQ